MRIVLIIFILSLISPSLLAGEKLIVFGKVKSVSLYKNTREDNFKEEDDGSITVSNACGRYAVGLDVVDVIVGKYSESEIVINGSIGEWCNPPILLLPDSYIFELHSSSSGYQQYRVIEFFDTEDDYGLAAVPYAVGDIDDGLVSAVEFSSYYSELYFLKSELDEEFWKYHEKSWFKEEDENTLFFSKGIPYSVLKEFIKSKGTIK